MAFLRKRGSGNCSLVFKWKGKSYIKALGTKDLSEAEQIKHDAENQLARIRRGEIAGVTHDAQADQWLARERAPVRQCTRHIFLPA